MDRDSGGGAGGADGATGGDMNDCATGERDYAARSALLLSQPGAISCQVDADCSLLPGDARCGAPCAANPVNAARVPDIVEELHALSDRKCSTCPISEVLCLELSAPFCLAGSCTLNPQP